MVLLTGGALATGCGSATARREAGKPAPRAGLRRVEAGEVAMARAAQAHAHYGAGVIHEMNNEPDAAFEEYYEAARLDPGNEALVLDVSRRCLQKKQFDKALELVTRAAAERQASGAIFARLGLIYSELGRTEPAVAANRTAIKKAPGLLAGYRNLFLTYLQAKRNEEALTVLAEAGRQTAAEPEFLLGLSELYLNYSAQAPTEKDKARAKALAALERVAKLNPRAPGVRMMLADSFAQLGETGKAAPIYLELVKQLADAPLMRERVQAKLTEIYLRAADRKHAVEQLEAIVREDPTNPAAYYYLGTIAFEEKRWKEAADYFGKTILLSPEFEQAYYDLASAQMDLNKGAEALATLAKARQKFAQNAQSFVLEFLTGLAYSREKSYTRALECFTKAEVIARAVDPKRLNQFFYFELGATYERTGDYSEAENYFEKCLKLAPDFAGALNYLGYMWAEHDKNLGQAREMIERALKAEPKNAAYLDSLGWVLFKLQQPKEALGYVLKACELLEEPDPAVWDHLGDIYTVLQQPEKAREAWRKSLALEPSEAVRKKLGAESPPGGEAPRKEPPNPTP